MSPRSIQSTSRELLNQNIIYFTYLYICRVSTQEYVAIQQSPSFLNFFFRSCKMKRSFSESDSDEGDLFERNDKE